MDTSLSDKIRASIRTFESMTPVDKAILRVQQKASFVKGNVGMDVDWSDAHQKALDDDPSVILMNEVLRLRAAPQPPASPSQEGGMREALMEARQWLSDRMPHSVLQRIDAALAHDGGRDG